MKLSEVIIKELDALPGGYNPSVHDKVVENLIKRLSPVIQKKVSFEFEEYLRDYIPPFKTTHEIAEYARKQTLGTTTGISKSNTHHPVEDAVQSIAIGITIGLLQTLKAFYGKNTLTVATMIVQTSWEKSVSKED